MLPHYGNIVINHNCKIGKNCRVHVGVNIGNNCYIAPGAKLYGDIIIQDNTLVGANAVVDKSCFEKMRLWKAYLPKI